jgi:hypothetical protein
MHEVGGSAPASHRELGENHGDVEVHGANGHHEPFGDLGVCQALSQNLKRRPAVE